MRTLSGRVKNAFTRLFFLQLIGFFIFLFGCSSLLHQPSQVFPPPTEQVGETFLDKELRKEALFRHFHQWKGTPYKIGGLSKRGIDCSGFVHLSYRNSFGLEIPRTTKNLQKFGNRITKNHLTVGDLIFFRTGFFTRHVGIYMEDNLFIHASTKKGVILSDLRERYWQEAYLKSIRIFKTP